MSGIDYGFGRTNVNHETGIRFGVISQHSISQAWSDNSEPDYGEPTCPKCGSEVRAPRDDVDGEPFEQYGHGCADYECETCEITIDSSDAFGEEAIGFNYDDDGYQMTDCLDSDVMIIASPYFTYAPYCSPCVPGAGNLDIADADGVKTYCVSHDWFEDGFTPYDVYDVATGELVPPPPTAVVYGQSSLLPPTNYLYASTSEHVADAPYYRAFWIVPGTL